MRTTQANRREQKAVRKNVKLTKTDIERLENALAFFECVGLVRKGTRLFIKGIVHRNDCH